MTILDQLDAMAESFKAIFQLMMDPRLTDNTWQHEVARRIAQIRTAYTTMENLDFAGRFSPIKPDMVAALSECKSAMSILEETIKPGVYAPADTSRMTRAFTGELDGCSGRLEAPRGRFDKLLMGR